MTYIWAGKVLIVHDVYIKVISITVPLTYHKRLVVSQWEINFISRYAHDMNFDLNLYRVQGVGWFQINGDKRWLENFILHAKLSLSNDMKFSTSWHSFLICILMFLKARSLARVAEIENVTKMKKLLLVMNFHDLSFDWWWDDFHFLFYFSLSPSILWCKGNKKSPAIGKAIRNAATKSRVVFR